MLKKAGFYELDLELHKKPENQNVNRIEIESDDWEVLSDPADSEDESKWLAVEEDIGGNLHIMSIESIIPDLKVLNNSNNQFCEKEEEENSSDWDVIVRDYAVVSKSEFKSNSRKLSGRSRAKTLALGVTGLAAASLVPSVPLLTSVVVLNSADLIRFSAKGKLSTVSLDQKSSSLVSINKRLMLRNCQMASVSLITAAVTNFLFVSSAALLPILLLEHLALMQVAESIVSGTVCAVSSEMLLSSRNSVGGKTQVKKAVWGGVSGAASGVLRSPIGEVCVNKLLLLKN